MKHEVLRSSARYATTLASVIAITASGAAIAGEDLDGALEHIDTEAAFDAEIPAHLETVLERVGFEIAAQERHTDGDVVVLQNVRVIETIAPDEELWIDEIGIAQHDDGMRSGLVATRADGDVRGKFLDRAADERHYFAINANGAELSLLTESDEHFAAALPADILRFRGGSHDGVFHGAADAPSFGALFENFSLDFETTARSLDFGVDAGATSIDRAGALQGPAADHAADQRMTMEIEEFGITARNDGLDHQDTDMLFDLEALEGGATLELAGHAESITTEQREGDEVARSSMERADLEAFYGREELSLALETVGLHADGGVALGFLNQVLGGAQGETSPDLSLTADRQRFAFSLPAVPGEEAQDIALELLLEQVAPSEDVWMMVDPDGALDREPLELALNLDGTAVAEQHVVSAAAGAMGAVFMGGAPEQQLLGAVESLDVGMNGRLQAIGAQIALDADMTLDAADQLPHLISTIKMSGVEDALSNVAASPLVDEADVMGAAMAVEMFTMPADDGGRVMEFEGKSDGSALLNGNPM